MIVAVFWDNCFLQLSWLVVILRAILPNSMIKWSPVSFGDLILACRGSLHNLSIWIDLTFKIFQLVYEEGSIILIYTYSRLSEKCIICFSENTLRQIETCSLSIGFGAMEISFKSESLTSLSNSKWHNCLRYAHFATSLTPSSSKISSVFSVSHKLQIFFNRWT